MRVAVVILLTLLATPTTSGSILEFSQPVAVAGHVGTGNATWIVIAFGDEEHHRNPTLHVSGFVENTLTSRFVTTVDATPSGPADAAAMGPETPFYEGPLSGTIELAIPGGFSTIVARVSSADLQFVNASSTIEYFAPPACLGFHMGAGFDYHAIPPNMCLLEGSIALRFSPVLPPSFSGSNLTISELYLHNFEARCNTEQCLSGGDFFHRTLYDAGGRQAKLSEYEFSRITADDLVLSGVSRASHVLVGGPSLDISFDGVARLPLARGSPCDGCPEVFGETLRLQGDLTLQGISGNPDTGTLSATVTGQPAALRLDEGAWGSPQTIITATGTAIGLALLVKMALLALRSHLADPLKHGKRSALHAYIENHPGATFRELVRETGIATGTARHHVAVLVRHGVVLENRHEETLRYFRAGAGFEDSWEEVVLLREPTLAHLHEWLQAAGAQYQKDVIDAASQWGWSRSTTQHRLKRLEAGGLLQVISQGRLKRYQASATAANAGAAGGSVATKPATPAGSAA